MITKLQDVEKLSELYNKTLKDKSWDYFEGFFKENKNDYSRTEIYNRFIQDPFSAKNSKDFIIEWFKLSGKNTALFQNFLNQLDEKRIRHTVSTFFLGFIFYKNADFIKGPIDKAIKELNIKNNDDEKELEKTFAYLWFLIALFHDLGYAIEDNKIKPERTEKPKDCPYLHGRKRFIPSIYSKENIERYKKFRQDRHNVKDHGIYGGEAIYYELCKLREAKYADLDDSNKKLYWGPELIRGFRCAAWTIICHNIYFIDEKDENYQYYQNLDLGDFILKSPKERAISFEEHPFLFLFSIIDTIEPSKSVKKHEDLEKLKGLISLDFSKNSEDLKDLINLDFSEYFKKLTNLISLDFSKDLEKLEGLINSKYSEDLEKLKGLISLDFSKEKEITFEISTEDADITKEWESNILKLNDWLTDVKKDGNKITLKF